MRIRPLIALCICVCIVTGCELDTTYESSSQTETSSFQDEAVDSSYSVDSSNKEIAINQPPHRRWWHDVVIYQIWPRSFYDTDGDGNGDIKGVIEKLPYLKDMGIGAVWLTPIFESPSYHGYDTTNFYGIDSDFGTLEDFEAFLDRAEALGIKVILDLVINHVSDQHPWFLKSVDKAPGYEDYFVWSETLPTDYGRAWSDVPDPTKVWHTKNGREGWYYGTFGHQQPDLNLQNPVVAAEIKKIAGYWIDKGVDGFRLDAVRYLIEEGGMPLQADTASSRAFLQDFSAFVKSRNPNVYLVGEAFVDNGKVSTYFDNGKSIDAAFDFDFSMTIRQYLEVTGKDVIFTEEEKNKNIALFRNALRQNIESRAVENSPTYFFTPFVNNHDIDRLMVHVDNSATRARVAASLLLTSPGTPYLYYGEEIGMSQRGLYDDTYIRGIMQWDNSASAGFNSTEKRWLDDASWFPWKQNFEPWWKSYWMLARNNSISTVAAQADDSTSLLHLYKTLIKIRNHELTIRAPKKIRVFESTGNAWVIEYVGEIESLWLALNLDPDRPTEFEIPSVIKGRVFDLISNTSLTLSDKLQLKKSEILILRKVNPG